MNLNANCNHLTPAMALAVIADAVGEGYSRNGMVWRVGSKQAIAIQCLRLICATPENPLDMERVTIHGDGHDCGLFGGIPYMVDPQFDGCELQKIIRAEAIGSITNTATPRFAEEIGSGK